MGAKSSKSLSDKVSRVSASSLASSQKLGNGSNLSVVSSGSKVGDYYVEKLIKDYADSGTTVVVHKVLWYMSDMRSLIPGLAHEFLLLELLPFAEYKTSVFIRVEKNRVLKGDTTKEGEKMKPGGWIFIKSVNPAKLGKGVKLKGEVDLSGCGKILMKDLLENLKDHSLLYSLWKHSCWKYAYDALMKLLKLLEGLPDTSEECKKRIRHDRGKLPPPKLPLNILCGGAICFVIVVATLFTPSVVAVGMFKFVASLLKDLACGVQGLAGSSLAMNLGRRRLLNAFAIGTLKTACLVTLPSAVRCTFVNLGIGFQMMYENHSVGTSAS